MLRPIAELVAYGTFALLLAAASLAPEPQHTASSATTGSTAVVFPAPVVSSSRGALLFATKGCIGCHSHASFPNAHMQMGPDLTGLPDRAATRVAGLDARAYVRQSLRDPSAYRVTAYSAVMPDLHLSDEEIESLSAFLLSPSH